MKGLSGFAWIVIIIIAVYIFQPSIFTNLLTRTVTPTTPIPSGPSVTCPSTMQTTIKTAIKNPYAGSLSYQLANLTIVDANTGEVKDAGDFTVAGTSKTYSTGKALSCGDHYKIYTSSYNNGTASNYSSCSKDLGIISGDTFYNDMECVNATEPEFSVFTTAWANETGNANNDYWVKDAATTTTQTMGTGSKYTFILRYRANSTYSGGSQFGGYSPELSTYVCADYQVAYFSITQGITVDRTDWIDVPVGTVRWCANAGYDKAWKIPALTTKTADQEVRVSLNADLGNPSTDPRIYFVDEAFYTGVDGKIHFGSTDDSGNDLGKTNRYIDLNIG